MDQQSFYLILPSNVQSSPSNSLSNFLTILAKQITLQGSWRVALTEISYTNSIYNVAEDEPIYLYDCDMRNYLGKDGKDSFLKKGYYKTEGDLLKSINKILKDFPVKQPPRVKYNSKTHKIVIKDGLKKDACSLFVHFSSEMRNMLGLAKTASLVSDINYNWDSKTEVSLLLPTMFEEAESPIDMKAGRRAMLVYTDIVEPVFIGDTQAQILRTVEVPESATFGEQVVFKYSKPYYIPLITNDFSTIRVNIKSDDGIDIPFEFGRVVLTLHFQKWKE